MINKLKKLIHYLKLEEFFFNNMPVILVAKISALASDCFLSVFWSFL